MRRRRSTRRATGIGDQASTRPTKRVSEDRPLLGVDARRLVQRVEFVALGIRCGPRTGVLGHDDRRNRANVDGLHLRRLLFLSRLHGHAIKLCSHETRRSASSRTAASRATSSRWTRFWTRSWNSSEADAPATHRRDRGRVRQLGGQAQGRIPGCPARPAQEPRDDGACVRPERGSDVPRAMKEIPIVGISEASIRCHK